MVEGDADIRELVAKKLRMCGHRVAVAENAATGWDLAVVGDYDLIVVDWSIRGGNGGEFCRQLRRSSPHRDTPILLTSTDAGGDTPEQAAASGATDYLTKPFSFHGLALKVEQLLANGRSH